jgi:hypothetical protein
MCPGFTADIYTTIYISAQDTTNVGMFEVHMLPVAAGP